MLRAMVRSTLAPAVATTAALLLLLDPSLARACAPAPPPMQSVRIEAEDALIVWDEAAHVEHFIRTAKFASSGPSFGFLVPTPSAPTLAETDPALFEKLDRLTAPEIRYSHYASYSPSSSGGCGCFGGGRGPGAPADFGAEPPPPPPVRVLAEQKVAGLDATVVEADSASALGEWLAAHGFELRESLQRWLVPYVEKKWKLTAFRYDQPNGPATFASTAVRLSFATDVPFYPYREPDDTPSISGRALRLFVLSSTEQVGQYETTHAPWAVQAPFSGEETPERAGIAGLLPGVDLPSHLWLDEFDDTAPQRAAADVVFIPAERPAERRPPPVYVRGTEHRRVPFELGLAFGGLWWLRARGQSKARTDGRTRR
jgi:hypothetical protein